MIIVITCVIAIAVIAFILGVRPKDLPVPEPESPFQHLDERKAAIYENLRDLQFEYRVGKLSDQDYQTTKKDLQKELAGVLAEVDKIKLTLNLNGSAPPPAPKPAPAKPTGFECRILRREVRQTSQVLRRVRQAHEGDEMRKTHNPNPQPPTPNPLFIFFLLASSAHAAITGTVINRTTGQPQPGATVALNKLGQGGIEMIDQAKSDAQGKFTINQEIQGPHLIRTAYDGVTYNHMLPPGSPTTGVTVDVYNSSKQPGAAKVSKHMLLFEPSNGQMLINESFIFANDGKTAWNDSDNGTLHFYAHSVVDRVQANATAPGGMPIGAPVNKTSKPDIYAVDFPVKPGETRFDLTYTVPYTEGATLRRQSRHQGREHLPHRAQRHHAHGRGPERSRRRAPHPGAHLRPFWNFVQDPVDRRRSRAAGVRRRPARIERPADRTDHAPRLQPGAADSGSRTGHPGAGIRHPVPRPTRSSSSKGVE